MDVSTFPDLDVSGRDIDEDASIIECLRRGLSMSAGTLDYAPEQGFDIRALLSRGVNTAQLFSVEDAVAAQARRDERIAQARATATYQGEALSIALVLVKTDGSLLKLTVAADALSLTLLRET